MADDLICPGCDSDEHLFGERDGDVIHIRCEACAVEWDRELTPRCPHCGETELRAALRPVCRSRGPPWRNVRDWRPDASHGRERCGAVWQHLEHHVHVTIENAAALQEGDCTRRR